MTFELKEFFNGGDLQREAENFEEGFFEGFDGEGQRGMLKINFVDNIFLFGYECVIRGLYRFLEALFVTKKNINLVESPQTYLSLLVLPFENQFTFSFVLGVGFNIFLKNPRFPLGFFL